MLESSCCSGLQPSLSSLFQPCHWARGRESVRVRPPLFDIISRSYSVRREQYLEREQTCAAAEIYFKSYAFRWKMALELCIKWQPHKVRMNAKMYSVSLTEKARKRSINSHALHLAPTNITLSLVRACGFVRGPRAILRHRPGGKGEGGGHRSKHNHVSLQALLKTSWIFHY